MRLLLIDNYDSFTYNIARGFEELGAEVMVMRNDSCNLEKVAESDFLVIGPGPGDPREAGLSKPCLSCGMGRMPILGICLGHQVIGEFLGGRVTRAERAMHGMTSPIIHDGKGIFRGLPQSFLATRYHSLILERESLPADLVITAETESGEIMALQHRNLPIFGVQFHPESIATPEGSKLLANFSKSEISTGTI